MQEQWYNATELCATNNDLDVMGFVLTITSSSIRNLRKILWFRHAPSILSSTTKFDG